MVLGDLPSLKKASLSTDLEFTLHKKISHCKRKISTLILPGVKRL
jgi:hypothetical protein